MKVKEDFLLRQIAGKYIVVPVGERVIDFKGMIMLNNSGKFIWSCLHDEISYEKLLELLMSEYEVEEKTARADLDEFLKSARECGVIQE